MVVWRNAAAGADIVGTATLCPTVNYTEACRISTELSASGLVTQVFTKANLESLDSDQTIGHTRYSRTGSSCWDSAQPTFRGSGTEHFAIAHNCNLTNTPELAERVAAYRGHLAPLSLQCLEGGLPAVEGHMHFECGLGAA